MKSKIITEIADFIVLDHITNDEVIRLVDYVEKEFHTKQKGFIDTELVKGKEEKQWLMIQHWRTIEEAKQASANMMKSEAAEEFRDIMDKKNVKLMFLEQIRTWS